MNDLRFMVKVKLVHSQKRFLPCPLCQLREPGCVTQMASQMHEIIAPPMAGGKYQPEDTPLARAVYTPENCILLCGKCNLEIANSVPKDVMLAIKMTQPGFGPERVIPVIKEIACYVKNPSQFIPRVVSCNGIDYPIL